MKEGNFYYYNIPMDDKQTIEALVQRVQELEVRERDLLLAAEMGSELLDINAKLEQENMEHLEEKKALQQKLTLHKNVRSFFHLILGIL